MAEKGAIVGIWILDQKEDGKYTLTAPNGADLFAVNIETLEMLGRMFLDEVESRDSEDRDDPAEDLWGQWNNPKEDLWGQFTKQQVEIPLLESEE